MENQAGTLNNYKGVMLCARPNEPQQYTVKQKPFCSRVDNKAQLGLNPVQQQEEFERPQKVNMVLRRHKDWLEVFKLKMKYKREMQEDNIVDLEIKNQKIKEQAAIDRVRTRKMKEEFNALNTKIMEELDDNPKPKQGKLTSNNLKKLEEINRVVDDYDNNDNDNEYYKNQQQQQQLEEDEEVEVVDENKQTQKSILKKKQPHKQQKQNKNSKSKPKWAYTEEQIKAEQEKDDEDEADDLLNFVDNLDYDKYVDDLEVQTMIKSIKNRVDELKQDVDWREKAKQRIQQKRQEIRQSNNNNNQNETSSQASFDGAKSVASERTQESIQSLRSELDEIKQGNSKWDNTTVNGGDKNQTVEEKIAKLVADEVLRNYKNLGQVHSNRSIRQMLEKEAGKHLQPTKLDIAQRYDGPNITVVKERILRKDIVDPQNLPYMHRNPAV